MIYLQNTSGLSQEVLIARDEPFSGASGGGSCRQCYEEGYREGEQHQKDKLSAITVESNGTYERPDGYSSVTVNVDTEQAYEEGYRDGETAGIAEGEQRQREKLSAITIDSNGDYTRADGWSAVTVNVDEGQAYQEGYQDGYIEGRAYQKSLLSNLSVTDNGTYSDEDGYATVEVNVPQGESYESGYTDGFRSGFTSGYTSGYSAGSAATSGTAYQEGYTDGFQSGYTSGYSAGSAATSGTAYQEGYESGFTSGYTSGYTDGLAEGYDIRGRMITSTGITENGTYTNVSGWSAITVNVPQSGGTPGTEIHLTCNTFSASTYGRYYFDYDQSTPISSITISFTVQPEPPVPPASGDYLTFIAIEDGTFKYTSPLGINTLSYSLDSGSTWISLSPQTDTPTVSAGDMVLWKGNCTTYNNQGTVNFYSTGKINVEGNVMSLLFGDYFEDKVSLSGYTYCFKDLFANTKTVNAENLVLPATTLENNCYNRMFWGCKTLEIAPSVLPATELVTQCYNSMFWGCTSLTTAPALPATTLAMGCYLSMFWGCTSLTTSPVLPATTLVSNCYHSMFSGCTSLTTAPALPATTLTGSCYYEMFAGCTSLTTAPVLPATTLAVTCYYNMFKSCTNLNYIKCLATDISATDCTYNWVMGVSGTGTFVKDAGMSSWTSGVSGIPNGWTVQ